MVGSSEGSLMRRVVILASILFPLGACESEPDVEARNASVEEVAEQVRQASGSDQFIRPGKWVSNVTFEEMIAPGMPPGAVEQMRSMMGGGQSDESCLTEEQVARPDEDFFAGSNNQCRYDHFTMGNGRIDAKMRCGEGEIRQVMEMEGTYSPESYQMRMATSFEGAPEPASGMTMRMRIDADRVGECDPAES